MIPSSEAGSFEKAFFSISTINPARKPAKIPPRKPDTVLPPFALWKAKSAINFWKPLVLSAQLYPVTSALPLDARSPPVKPTASPGRSAIEYAIYPASTGTISPIASPPLYLKNADSGVQDPNALPPVAP